jgi:hypothetical protein
VRCLAAQILAATKEKLSDAKREVAVLQSLSHVNCLPLLAHSITPTSSAAAGRGYEVLLVFPAYQVCPKGWLPGHMSFDRGQA